MLVNWRPGSSFAPAQKYSYFNVTLRHSVKNWNSIERWRRIFRNSSRPYDLLNRLCMDIGGHRQNTGGQQALKAKMAANSTTT